METRYSKQSQKYLRKIDSDSKERIKKGIEGLKNTPITGDVRPMEDTRQGDYRLRIGGFRVMFSFGKEIINGKEEKVLLILKIGKRGDIYK